MALPTKSKSTVMSCDFEIRAEVPKEALELFAAAQAKILGLRGYIIRVSDDFYKGQLQGEGEVIEAFEKLIATAAEFVAAIREFIIKNLKAIDQYTYEAFEVRKAK